MPKPLLELTLVNTGEILSHPQESIWLPLEPITPRTTQNIASLQKIIINQVARGLDESGVCSLQKNVQKLSKAAHIAFSNKILQRDRIQFLIQINNKAKTRWLTRAEILGKAKVMGFEELEEARAKRAEQLATKIAKGTSKPGRKRKATLEGEER